MSNQALAKERALVKNNDYFIYVGAVLIGMARDVGDDMPNTGGRFEPTDAFNEFKQLF